MGQRHPLRLLSRLRAAARNRTGTTVREHEVAELLEALEFLRSAQKAPAKGFASGFVIPRGWHLVPLEATEAMIAAYWGPDGLRVAPGFALKCVVHAVKHQGQPRDEPGFLTAWRAMVLAAPSPGEDH